MENKKVVGNDGEKKALEYLKNKGYQILHTNWQYGHKEIDIVAVEKETLVIVEVKTRSNDFFANPQDSVDKRKQRFLIDAADAYIRLFDINYETRFDIIGIVGEKIVHFENAYSPNW